MSKARMSEDTYQATVVGKDTIPGSSRKLKWGFLQSLLGTLSPGQAIRIVIPEGESHHGVLTVWRRIVLNKGATNHNRTVKQADGSWVVYLWYDK